MTEEQRGRIAAIKDPNKEIGEIYALFEELGISFKKTRCYRCRRDLWNILREEAGLIGDASEESTFNGEDNDFVWVWNGGRAVAWNGHIMNASTPQDIVREYIKVGGERYYHIEQTNND